jgi:hypothetical protein
MGFVPFSFFVIARRLSGAVAILKKYCHSGVCRENLLASSFVIPDLIGNPVFLSLRNASQVMMTFRLRCGNLKKYCHSLFLLSSLMGLFPVNPLVRRAVWAYAMLNSFDKPISEPSLLLSCVSAYRTLDAALSHFFVFFGY